MYNRIVISHTNVYLDDSIIIIKLVIIMIIIIIWTWIGPGVQALERYPSTMKYDINHKKGNFFAPFIHMMQSRISDFCKKYFTLLPEV